MSDNPNQEIPSNLQKSNTYPYVFTMTSFKNMINFIEQTGRGPKNADDFIELGLSSNITDANQCLNVARKFKMMDNEGNLSDIGRKFRLEKTRKEICKDVLNENFSELNKRLQENPGHFPTQQLEEHLINEDKIKSKSVIAKILLMLKELSRGFPQKSVPSKSKQKKTTKSESEIIILENPKEDVNTQSEETKSEKAIAHITNENPIEDSLPVNNESEMQGSQLSVDNKSEVPSLQLESNEKISDIPYILQQILHIKIDKEWDDAKINLVFDRVEALLKKLKE
ncbi:MAG: hypothetical protein RBG13Loki_0419 [Promethearchaeota archaeon CR_4]|nr:MAG: hypothetical protein RBG13Loki_0419 [Candidatus Lokiarchaeota archaeon CR_4]